MRENNKETQDKNVKLKKTQKREIVANILQNNKGLADIVKRIKNSKGDLDVVYRVDCKETLSSIRNIHKEMLINYQNNTFNNIDITKNIKTYKKAIKRMKDIKTHFKNKIQQTNEVMVSSIFTSLCNRVIDYAKNNLSSLEKLSVDKVNIINKH